MKNTYLASALEVSGAWGVERFGRDVLWVCAGAVKLLLQICFLRVYPGAFWVGPLCANSCHKGSLRVC